MKVILLDDEKLATELLALKLRKLGMGVEIIAQFNQPEVALETLRTTPFDLLFLDIEMPRLNGFDLLAQLDPFSFDVIFTTAYDQYAIRAFRYSALSYLLKPIREDELREVIVRWQQRSVRQLHQAQLSLLREQYQTPTTAPRSRIALPTNEGHAIVEIADIVRCMADASYTHIYLTNNRTLLICRTLKEVEQALDTSGFVRTHHSHLINPAYLTKIVRQDGGYLLMADGAQVPVTKLKRDWLLEQIGGIERT
ncbi:LytR/AlgR family response regulator transcription factor [Spirosoma montaniterrae]|uniref:LytTR family transcriptional regulator n=1 Tax=Spirosoma montaniterrae TaxID=1178516 RepID=A0A1P9WVT0_9BACT|nr:LytTR family DNA-binding domain-containing protein [Spirosoma montaniterrae]AQG79438.1 LytTR family transcriptional regulator [Spirosoma montaniterrae]